MERDPSSNPNWGHKLVSTKKWPWLVGIYLKPSRGEFATFKCTGALIDEQFVLTAASCVHGVGEPALVALSFGSHHLITHPGGAHKFKRAAKIIVHQEYTTDRMSNDIALIKLRHEVLETDLVEPICLPTNTDKHVILNKRALVVGWYVFFCNN